MGDRRNCVPARPSSGLTIRDVVNKIIHGSPDRVETADRDGNQPLTSVTLHKGERVRRYLMSMGTEADLQLARVFAK